jgi:hypothetical protein
MTTATNQTLESVGRRIGRAIAQDVIAHDMPREWTGLDAQDAEQIPDGMDQDEVERIAKDEYTIRIMATKKATVTALTMPMCRYGSRSGFATAVVDGVAKRLHTSRSDRTDYSEHEADVREMFADGKGENA